MMGQLLLKWMLIVCAACAGLTVAALALGRGLTPSAMLAYGSYHQDNYTYSVSVFELTRGLTLRIYGGGAGMGASRWSADGRLAFAAERDANSEIYLWDGITLSNITQTPNISEEMPRWSADGRLAYTSYDGVTSQIYIWDGALLDSFSIRETQYNGGAVWSRDGRLLAYETTRDGDSEIYVWDGEHEQNVSQNHSALDYYPAWSYEGRLAYVERYSDVLELYVWDGVATQQITREYGVESIYGLSWGADGRLAVTLLFSEGGTAIYVWDGETLAEIAAPNAEYSSHAVWMANGDLSFSARNYTSYDIYVWDSVSYNLVTATPLVNEALPQWSADGRLATYVLSPHPYTLDLFVWKGSDSINITRSLVVNDFGAAWWSP